MPSLLGTGPGIHYKGTKVYFCTKVCKKRSVNSCNIVDVRRNGSQQSAICVTYLAQISASRVYIFRRIFGGQKFGG